MNTLQLNDDGVDIFNPVCQCGKKIRMFLARFLGYTETDIMYQLDKKGWLYVDGIDEPLLWSGEVLVAGKCGFCGDKAAIKMYVLTFNHGPLQSVTFRGHVNPLLSNITQEFEPLVEALSSKQSIEVAAPAVNR